MPLNSGRILQERDRNDENSDNFMYNFVNRLIDAVVELENHQNKTINMLIKENYNNDNNNNNSDNSSKLIECINQNVPIKNNILNEHFVLEDEECQNHEVQEQIKEKKKKMKIFHNLINFNWTKSKIKHKDYNHNNNNNNNKKTERIVDDISSSSIVNEEYDDFPNQFTPIFPLNDSSLSSSSFYRSKKKSVSVFELNNNNNNNNTMPKLQRSSSTLKRIFSFGHNNNNNNNNNNDNTSSSINFLKRSLSLRDLVKKKTNHDDKKWITKKEKLLLMENNGNNWKRQQSLQSLVESDCFNGSTDLSFINYDALNEFHYNDDVSNNDNCYVYDTDDDSTSIEIRNKRNNNENRFIERTQSMKEKEISPHIRKLHSYKRQTSVIPTTSDFKKSSIGSLEFLPNSSTISLPSTLFHTQLENDKEGKYKSSTSRNYHHNRINSASFNHHRSINETHNNPSDSFRSTGSASDDSNVGGVGGGGRNRLKRHNATRLKYNPTIFISDSKQQDICCITGHINNGKELIEKQHQEIQPQQEWKKFVGSFKRKIQKRNVSTISSSSSAAAAAVSTASSSSKENNQSKNITMGTKNSLTKTLSATADFLINKKSNKNSTILPKQKSMIGLESIVKKNTNSYCGLSINNSNNKIKENNSIADMTIENNDADHHQNIEKIKRDISKHNLTLCSKCSNSGSRNNSRLWNTNCANDVISRDNDSLKQDDFVKAAMRIFLVVSPTVSKLQVRSRSLTHLDSLQAAQQASVSPTTNRPTSIKNYTTQELQLSLKDSKSVPNCTELLQLSTGENNVEQHTEVTKEFVRSPLATSPDRNYISRKTQTCTNSSCTVYYEIGDDSMWDWELLPVQHGVTLYEALSKQCECRGIDLSLCDVKLVQDKDDNSNNTENLFNQDSTNLIGKQIRIIENDQVSAKKHYTTSRPSIHTRKSSGNYRQSRTFGGGGGGGTFFNSSSTEEPSNIQTSLSTLSLSPHQDIEQNKKQIKQRLTAFFGNSKDMKYEVLIEQLDKYSKHGIPHNVIYPQGQCESIDALYKLENDWRDIIQHNDLNERQQQQQTALWELIKTEVAYIKTLKVVTNLFLGCLKDLQTKNVFKEINTEKLFSNITEILDANVIFWRNTLFPLVKDMRRHHRPPCLENMLDGFLKINDIFQPYYKYCAEQSRCQHYCRENIESDIFTAYLTWCESQKDCNRLRLMDILVQPMQRLTKYGLLLKAILKNTDEDVEKESLQAMIKMVDEFVNNVNSSLKHRQDKERLKGIIARIESYDIVETRDDDIERLLKKEKSFTQLDLTKPMLGCSYDTKRHLLLEGDLKLKDGSASSKIEVHCFLLTDMLLICKSLTKKSGLTSTMKVIRQPYLVDRLTIHELNHRETASLAIIYRNEFDMAVAAFILQSNDGNKIKGWKAGIMKAKQLYTQARQMSNHYFTESNECFHSSDQSLDTCCCLENDNLQQIATVRSPLVSSSSRASRVSSSLAHSHSGSVEMNDASSNKDQSLQVTRSSCACDQISFENNENHGSISSDEGLQPLPLEDSSNLTAVIDRSNAQKTTLKTIRLFHKSTPNTLSVQSVNNLGQSLPNLTLASPKIGEHINMSSIPVHHNNTLSVPISSSSSSSSSNYKSSGNHLLSPTQRGISYPPPSPTRGNLRRSHAIVQQRNKNPPLIKTRQVQHSTSLCCSAPQQQHGPPPTSIDIDVPIIAARAESCDIHRSHYGQSSKLIAQQQFNTVTGIVVDDIKMCDHTDSSMHKRLSWNNSVQRYED